MAPDGPGLDTPRKMTLDECAHCVNQLNLDLQRQTDAYRYFCQTTAKLSNVLAGTASTTGLPFITINFPTAANAGKPGEHKLDLNSLPRSELADMAPLFEALTTGARDNLLRAWVRLLDVVKIAEPQVREAQQEIATDGPIG